MTEQREKEIMNFIAQNTVPGTHLEASQKVFMIHDLAHFVQILVEFLETKKKN